MPNEDDPSLGDLRRFLRRNAYVLAPFFVGQAVLLYLGFFANWFTFCILASIVSISFLIVFSDCGQALIGLIIARPRRAATLLFSLIFLACSVAYLPVRAWAYRTGKFGEPTNNRYITIHEASTSRMVLEFGVTTTPLERFDVVLKFSNAMCMKDGGPGGFAPRGKSEAPRKTVMMSLSGHATTDPTVFIVSPVGRLTSHESLYLEFTGASVDPAFHDCRFQGAAESYENGMSCIGGEVTVNDLSGKGSYKPLALGTFYSVNDSGTGIFCD